MTKEKSEITKMEFLLTLNDNIIVQRYFNVKSFNDDAQRSIDLHHTVDEIYDTLHGQLKNKTVWYMLDNMYQIMEAERIMDTANTDGPENFNISVKNSERVIYHRQWDGKVYPPKVRYTVDVRPQLKKILRSLTEVFSTDKITQEYMGYNLA